MDALEFFWMLFFFSHEIHCVLDSGPQHWQMAGAILGTLLTFRCDVQYVAMPPDHVQRWQKVFRINSSWTHASSFIQWRHECNLMYKDKNYVLVVAMNPTFMYIHAFLSHQGDEWSCWNYVLTKMELQNNQMTWVFFFSARLFFGKAGKFRGFNKTTKPQLSILSLSHQFVYSCSLF